MVKLVHIKRKGQLGYMGIFRNGGICPKQSTGEERSK